jgi:hypothetical protein
MIVRKAPENYQEKFPHLSRLLLVHLWRKFIGASSGPSDSSSYWHSHPLSTPKPDATRNEANRAGSVIGTLADISPKLAAGAPSLAPDAYWLKTRNHAIVRRREILQQAPAPLRSRLRKML